jgi:hypothetical protein
LGDGWFCPVSLLLFIQWPLCDLVHAYSTQANDLAQWLLTLFCQSGYDLRDARANASCCGCFCCAVSDSPRKLAGKAAALIVLAQALLDAGSRSQPQ